MTPESVVLNFWQTMNTNDFAAASDLLAEDFTCFWPQSRELISGKEAFNQINSQYPASGKWQFTVNSILSDNNKVVTDVTVTDGATTTRAITFHTVAHGKIVKQLEYWPDPFVAPGWREAWVSIVPDDKKYY